MSTKTANDDEMSRENVRKFKIVFVGDSECGKTALLVDFARGNFSDEYEPTVFNSYTAEFEIEGDRVELSLWDTSGQADYDHVRPLSYSGADAAVVCFDISRPETTESVTNKWLKEIKEFCPGKPIILVGCKLDLRNDITVITELAKSRRIPVSHIQGCDLCKQIQAVTYVECCAKQMDRTVREVFDRTALIALGKPLCKKSKMKTGKRNGRKSKGCSLM